MTIPSGPDLRLCCILYDISQIGEIISHIVVPNLSGPAKGYTGQAKWRPSILKAGQMLKEIHWRNVNDLAMTTPHLLWHCHILWAWLDRTSSVLAKVATIFTNDPCLLIWSEHPISSQTYPAKAETRSFILAHEHHTLIRWLCRVWWSSHAHDHASFLSPPCWGLCQQTERQ